MLKLNIRKNTLSLRQSWDSWTFPGALRASQSLPDMPRVLTDIPRRLTDTTKKLLEFDILVYQPRTDI